MTKLKDLPEGTLLIGNSGRKGLYSNDNAPIFVMELGDKKANVLWQGTSRYDAFMHPLIDKGDLEKNVDYVLPEDIGFYLPTLLDTGSFMPSDPDAFCSKGTDEAYKGKYDSESDTLDEPTFKVHVGDRSLYLNVQNPGIDNHWYDKITLDDGRVVFVSDDTPYHNVQIIFTLAEYKDIYNKAKSMDAIGEEPSYLPEYDPSDTDNFELVHGESLPEDKGSEKAPTKEPEKEPKFTVQLTPYGDFLNEELLADTPSYRRGTADEDYAYLLNGQVLIPEDDSNNNAYKTHFTLEEYNDLREQVSLLEGHEDLSWSLPKYNPDNDIFTLAEGFHLPEPVKESKLPKWVKDIIDNLTEDADDPESFTKEINTLAQFMGDKNWGFYLYQKVRRMQSALKNHHYSKKEAVATSKLIVKEAKKYY